MDQSMDFIFKNGLVVTSAGIEKRDIAVKGEKIIKVAADLNPEGANRIIDSSGKYLLPGIIDVHCHPVYVDDEGGLSLTAAFGGVTSVIHYAYVKPGMEVMPTLRQFKENGISKSYLDFGLHLGLFDVKNQIKDLPEAFNFGATSFKVFMSYAKLKWMTDDYWMTAVMDVAAQEKGLVMIHAENGLATDYLEDKFLREGRSPIESFAAMRPSLLEAEAINRAMMISQVMGSVLYVVHNSAAECLEPISRAQENGWKVIGETCPQYLTLTEKTTLTRKAQAKIGPPLRTFEDNEALWYGLANGILDTVGSDHAPKPKKVDDNFFDAPYGSPQTETMLTVMYHHGVNGGRITLPRLVEVMSENNAKTFGWFPQKGIIAEGSDADIVLFDPTIPHVITKETQHSNVGFTNYEGMEVLGKPIMTMSRGNIVVENGSLVGKPGVGRFLPTSTSHLYD